ncbi:hypothetical protein [Sphingomonas sp. R86521]|uniref:hypothetical protein n=1 Tax=Sphingomonas sp. R86521 TaxID=3093860 RepID=UPI0036D3C04F
MKKLIVSVLPIVVVLAGCSKAPDAGNGLPVRGGDAAQMSYGYTYRFALPGDVVTQAQDRHIALCDQLGTARCRMQEMHRNAGTGSSAGSTRFVVASGDARRFGQALIAPVTALQGSLTSREFEAEDVSKQIADAQAKAGAKDSVANRTAVAEVQDRVATSSIWAYYDGKTSFGEQLGGAFGEAGETMRSSIIALIYVLSAVLPWALVLGVLFFVMRAAFRRVRMLFPRAYDSRSRRPVTEADLPRDDRVS